MDDVKDVYENFFSPECVESIEVKQALLRDEAANMRIMEAGRKMVAASAAGHRIFFAGNGGSAADAQHLSAELVSRYLFDRPGLPAMALSTDTSALTAIGNDYGYDHLFARQLQAQASPGDIFVGITTSGRSKNILAAFDFCKQRGIFSIALCGAGGELEQHADIVIRVPSTLTPRIQECHILIGHALCGLIEREIFSEMKHV
jgi:D-sedoheptulose 7-phosphate isomerase